MPTMCCEVHQMKPFILSHCHTFQQRNLQQQLNSSHITATAAGPRIRITLKARGITDCAICGASIYRRIFSNCSTVSRWKARVFDLYDQQCNENSSSLRTSWMPPSTTWSPLRTDALIPVRHISGKSLWRQSLCRDVSETTDGAIMRLIITWRDAGTRSRESLTAVRSASVRTSQGRRRSPPWSGWWPGAGPKHPPHRKPPPGGWEREMSGKRALHRLEVQVWEPCWAFPLLQFTFGKSKRLRQSQMTTAAPGLPGALSQLQSCIIVPCAFLDFFLPLHIYAFFLLLVQQEFDMQQRFLLHKNNS